MTEKELWCYREAMQEYKIACEDLEEFASLLNSASSSKVTDLPKAQGDVFPDRLSPELNTYEILLSKKKCAADKMNAAYMLLFKLRSALNKETERMFFWCRYTKGMSLKEIEAYTNRSHSSVQRDRAAVLEFINNLDTSVKL